MAKLITKFKYLKPTERLNRGDYAKYIATREGVDKIDESFKLNPVTVNQQHLIAKILRDFPDSKNSFEYEDYSKNKTVGTASEFITHAVEENTAQMMNSKTYADYIATRPRAERFGSHGLFTDDGINVNLPAVSQELNLHNGNMWTAIISLRREDAERLGFDTGERWRDMLRSQTQSLSESLKIPIQNLKWFAAFHNESHHPHVHLIAYSVNPKEGYLSKQGVNALRSSFAKDIFAQNLHFIYEKQTGQRNELKQHSQDMIADIIAKINIGIYDNPTVENLLLTLAERLKNTNGKKQYGYLRVDIKKIVDDIIDEIEKDERISALYNLWCESREEITDIYSEKKKTRIPLSQNKEFKSIKNVIIKGAMNIIADKTIIKENGILSEQFVSDPEPTDEETETPLTDKKDICDVAVLRKSQRASRQRE